MTKFLTANENTSRQREHKQDLHIVWLALTHVAHIAHVALCSTAKWRSLSTGKVMTNNETTFTAGGEPATNNPGEQEHGQLRSYQMKALSRATEERGHNGAEVSCLLGISSKARLGPTTSYLGERWHWPSGASGGALQAGKAPEKMQDVIKPHPGNSKAGARNVHQVRQKPRQAHRRWPSSDQVRCSILPSQAAAALLVVFVYILTITLFTTSFLSCLPFSSGLAFWASPRFLLST